MGPSHWHLTLQPCPECQDASFHRVAFLGGHSPIETSNGNWAVRQVHSSHHRQGNFLGLMTPPPRALIPQFHERPGRAAGRKHRTWFLQTPRGEPAENIKEIMKVLLPALRDHGQQDDQYEDARGEDQDIRVYLQGSGSHTVKLRLVGTPHPSRVGVHRALPGFQVLEAALARKPERSTTGQCARPQSQTD